jgi:hypothetical protein
MHPFPSYVESMPTGKWPELTNEERPQSGVVVRSVNSVYQRPYGFGVMMPQHHRGVVKIENHMSIRKYLGDLTFDSGAACSEHLACDV